MLPRCFCREAVSAHQPPRSSLLLSTAQYLPSCIAVRITTCGGLGARAGMAGTNLKLVRVPVLEGEG
jgi:hypothetical protein